MRLFVIFKHCGFKDLGAKVILLLFATENPRVQIAKSVNLEICRQEKLESCPRSSRTTRVLTTDGTIFFFPCFLAFYSLGAFHLLFEKYFFVITNFFFGF